MKTEFIIREPAPKPGWPCPACRGLGHMSDGSVSYGKGGGLDYFNGHLSEVYFTPVEIKLTPSTPCGLCRGKGRVNVVPIEDEAVT